MSLPPRGVLTVHSSDPGHVIAIYNPLILACFERQAKPEELETIDALATQGIESGIRGGLLYVVARKNMAGGIDPTSRATFERMVRTNAARSGANAVVILMDGFSGAIVRGFLAGLMHVTSRRQALRVCASVEEACEFLAAQHGLDAAALLRAYGEATAHIRGRASA